MGDRKMREKFASTLTQPQIKAANAAMIELLRPESGYEGATKAAALLDDPVRIQVREGSIEEQILDRLPVGPEDLAQVVDHDMPTYIGEIEAESPGALVVPIGGRPRAWYYFGRKYEARFSRHRTLRLKKDTSQLLTYKHDIRGDLTDNAVKDLIASRDHRFFQAINNLLSPGKAAAGQPLGPGETLRTGVIQWVRLEGQWTPSTLAEADKVLNKSTYGIDGQTYVINLETSKEFLKWDHDMWGGADIAQEVRRNGWTMKTMHGKRWIITIKNWIVPNGTMYIFGPQEFIGKNLVLTEPTMFVKKDETELTMWAYEEAAMVIANIAAVARVDVTLT